MIYCESQLAMSLPILFSILKISLSLALSFKWIQISKNEMIKYGKANLLIKV